MPISIAAFFCEPVIGAGGIYPPPDGYLTEVRQICREHDILFVADEVITGFGRIGGDWFASTRFDLQPDIMTTAKGLTSGYVPMGAVFVAPRVAEPFFDPDRGVWWRHGYTYGGHAAAAAAAMANLDIIEREIVAGAVGPAGDDAAREARAASPITPRWPRSAAAPERSPRCSWSTRRPPFGWRKRLRGQGIATRAVGAGGIQISPTFVITDEQVEQLVAGIGAALG